MTALAQLVANFVADRLLDVAGLLARFGVAEWVFGWFCAAEDDG